MNHPPLLKMLTSGYILCIILYYKKYHFLLIKSRGDILIYCILSRKHKNVKKGKNTRYHPSTVRVYAHSRENACGRVWQNPNRENDSADTKGTTFRCPPC